MKRFIPFEELIKFPVFSDLSREEYDKMVASSTPVSRPHVESRNTEEDSIVSFIFAPDPATGVPRSDLAFSMSKDTSPEVAQFIRDSLQRPVETGERTDDPDLALSTIKSRSESLIQYADRIRDIINKDVK